MAHPILVVGAGPTGLVLALALARRGVAVRVVDKNPGPAQASRAMAVHARTLEFYRQFGFAEDVVAGGIRLEQLHLHEAGRDAATFTLGDIGRGLSPFPFLLCYPQDDHERFLGAKLREAGVEVEWNTCLTGLTQDGEGVSATLAREGRQEHCRADFLCGSDGAHSAVRHALSIGFPGGSYDQLFLVADVETEEGGTGFGLSLDRHGFGLKLPVRSSGMQRLIGLVPPELSGRHDLTFEDIRPRLETLLRVRVQRVNWFSLYHVHHRVAERFRVGRCFIAGDAGHVHSPVAGQGMNTGIGDAINLGWKLADVARGRAGPEILDSFEPERIAFAHQLVATTDRIFKGAVGQGIGAELFRTVLMPHVFPFLTGFAAVRRAIFRAASQVRIAYHGSKLSQGRAGEVEGGDRLPWLAEPDNFAPLRSLDWQVHVYGEARPELRGVAEELEVPVHAYQWAKAAAEAGFARDAAYLIRPDGHVAVAEPKQDASALRDYARRVGLRAVAG